MSDKVELSRQQQKSKETKERIFRAAKRILQKKGYEELSIASIIILRQRTTFFPIISKTSRTSTQIFWICRRMRMRLRSPLYMST